MIYHQENKALMIILKKRKIEKEKIAVKVANRQHTVYGALLGYIILHESNGCRLLFK